MIAADAAACEDTYPYRREGVGLLTNVRLVRQLLTILGRRAFLSFGLVTFLTAALLSATNITSRYALKLYVEDQLTRTPWDLAVYHQSGRTDDALAARLHSVAGIQRIEQLVFLRAGFSKDISMVVDAQPFATPWLCVLSASDLNLLPPELRLALEQHDVTKAYDARTADGAILALIGPESAMGAAFVALQGARDFSLHARVKDRDHAMFSTPLQAVIRLEGAELNRWFMDQTGSITMVPPVAAILLMPFRADVIGRFDLAARGYLPAEAVGGRVPLAAGLREQPEYLPADYLPEISYLAQIDRKALISGWDIRGSRERFAAVRDQLQTAAKTVDSSVVVDSTALVLLERMERTADLIGALTLLIALPLLFMGWVLAANLAGLLMLNERRKLGLMRLRGVPGTLMGRVFLLAILGGGVLGSALGLLAGSIAPLLIYGRGRLPANVLTQPSQMYGSLLFLVVTLSMALLAGRRLVSYATTISPLEASGRIAVSEASQAEVRFGPLELLALLLGAYTLGRWIFGFSVSETLFLTNRTLDFIGLPLFIYGAVCLLVSKRSWIQRLLGPLVRLLGGQLADLALGHVALKPHRTATLLLTVALTVSICVYPTVTGPSFQDKAARGARVATGTAWQFTFNAPDLIARKEASKDLSVQLAALRPGIQNITNALSRVPEVTSVVVTTEAILPDLYLPGYGFRGVPLYVLEDLAGNLQHVYSEPELGAGQPYKDVLLRLASGEVAVSRSVADFWNLSRGGQVPIGMNRRLETINASVAGVLTYLPGMPLRGVTDRQGYVQARTDYLNHLFGNDGYLVISADNPRLAGMQVLVSRVVVLAETKSGASTTRVESEMRRVLPAVPLDVRHLDEEIRKVGSDMFVYLALANMRLFVGGGFLLALISILAIALVNYAEDRRTLALLRIRGASPDHIRRFLTALTLAPALLGVVVGGIIALLAGYGLANHLWNLRELHSVVQLLVTHLVVSSLTVAVSIIILIILTGAAYSFSFWLFRRSAHETIFEG